MSTAWALTLGELRAGLRRYGDTEYGERYQRVLAWEGEGDATPPDPHERTLGDYLAPTRPGRMMDVVNETTQLVGSDTADWNVDRLLRMVASAAGRFRHSDE